MKLWVAGFRMKWNLIAYLQDWVKLEGSKLVWLDTTDNLFTECQFPVLNAPPGRLVALYGQKGLEAQWRAYSWRRRYSHKVWSDAYLAAFGAVDRLELITFDRGFLCYDGLKLTLLEM